MPTRRSRSLARFSSTPCSCSRRSTPSGRSSEPLGHEKLVLEGVHSRKYMLCAVRRPSARSVCGSGSSCRQCRGGPGSRPRRLFNFPTKRRWRDDSRLDDIEAGLRARLAEVPRLKPASMAVPALGCGLGGLAWADVKPLIEPHSEHICMFACRCLRRPKPSRSSRPTRAAAVRISRVLSPKGRTPAEPFTIFRPVFASRPSSSHSIGR